MAKRKSERRFVIVSGKNYIFTPNGTSMTREEADSYRDRGDTICELVPVKQRAKQKAKAKRV